jgi:hypothetical protein
MSTRESIVYVAGLHIYREQHADEICMESVTDPRPENRKYGDPIITRAELAQIRDEIDAWLAKEGV